VLRPAHNAQAYRDLHQGGTTDGDPAAELALADSIGLRGGRGHDRGYGHGRHGGYGHRRYQSGVSFSLGLHIGSDYCAPYSYYSPYYWGSSFSVGYYSPSLSISHSSGFPNYNSSCDPWPNYYRPVYHRPWRGYFWTHDYYDYCRPTTYLYDCSLYYPFRSLSYTPTVVNYYSSPIYVVGSGSTSGGYAGTAYGDLYNTSLYDDSSGRGSSDNARGGSLTLPGLSELPPVAGDEGAASAATVFRATQDQGPMDWSVTATSIINAVMSAAPNQRARTAAKFLGRTPVGAWEVTVEDAPLEGQTGQMMCRSAVETQGGQRPILLIRTVGAVGGLERGQSLRIRGRLVELCVDDPSYPGGLLVLEDADVSW